MITKIIDILKIICAVISTYLIRKSGKDSVKVKQYEQQNKISKMSKAIENRNAHLSDDDISKLLWDKWSR